MVANSNPEASLKSMRILLKVKRLKRKDEPISILVISSGNLRKGLEVSLLKKNKMQKNQERMALLKE